METNYVELTGRLHRWDVRETRSGSMSRGWIEVRKEGKDAGTTKFPLICFDPDPDWEDYLGSIVQVSGRLIWSREYSDDNGDDRYIVNVHVDAMRFVRSARNGNEAKSSKSSKSSKPVRARNEAKAIARKDDAAVDEDDLPF